MNPMTIVIIIFIICSCILGYYQWDNIAEFWGKRTWRERIAILAVLVFVSGIGFIPRHYLNGSPTTIQKKMITPDQRRESKRDFDKWFLRQGYEVLIQIKGDNADNIEAQCPLFTRVTFQRFEDQGVLSKELARLGFERIHFYDYQHRWIGSIFPD